METRTQKLQTGVAWVALLLCPILLWSAEALGGWGVLLLPLLVLPLGMLVWEQRYGMYVLTVLLTAALILALPFLHYAWFGFVTVLSWYAPVRSLLSRIKTPRVGSLLALLFCSLGFAAGMLLLHLIGAHPLAGLDPFWLALLFTGVLIGFALLDACYLLFHRFYTRKLRKFLMV